MSDREISEFMKGVKDIDRRFEDQWLAKLTRGLDETVGEETRKIVLKGSDEVKSAVNPQEVIGWTKEVMRRVDSLLDEKERIGVMTGCACHVPERRLIPVRDKYRETKDLDLAYKMLRETFISDLRTGLKLDAELTGKIIGWGWGMAGVKEGNEIIATKMPFALKEYLEATDPKEKRYHYCHCPRIREAIKLPEPNISSTYCYCGAGFYKDIWEKILEQPVKVEVLETVLEGSTVCRIAIHLPRPL